MMAMLLWSIPFLIVAVIVFFLISKLDMRLRVGIALAIWLIPTIVLTMWVSMLGDKPPADARTVYPEKAIETPKKSVE